MTRKTRLELNAEKVSIESARRMSRITNGNWNFDKARIEAEHRQFVLHPDAEKHWNEQSCIPSWRTITVLRGDEVRNVALNDIMRGQARPLPPSAQEKAATAAKSSLTRISRGLGQLHFLEA